MKTKMNGGWRRLLRFSGPGLALLLLLGLTRPAAAQFTYSVFEGGAVITGYTGPGGSVAIPSALDGFPVTSIGASAFSGKASLTNVVVPGSVKAVDSQAFLNCVGLTNVTVQGSVTNVGALAFAGCTNLISIYFLGRTAPTDSGASIPTGATVYYLDGSDGWNTSFGGAPATLVSRPDYDIRLFNEGGIALAGYFGPGGVVTIPSDFLGLPVVSIDRLFQNKGNIYSVIVPNSVTLIASLTFRNCSGLTNVTLGTNLTRILTGAFLNCSNLTRVTLPASLANISSSVFRGCSKLGEIVIPPHVSSFGLYVFEGCSGLTNAVFQNSLTTLPEGLFSNCTNLSSVTLPGNLSSIQSGAFYGTSLTNFTISSNITSIGDNPFGACTSLKSFTVDPLNPQFASANGLLYDKSLTRLIAFPAGLGVSNYSLPSHVSGIENGAFVGCINLTNVTVPNNTSLTSVGAMAFAGCTNLISIYFLGTSAPVDNGAAIPTSAKVYYFLNSEGWNDTFGGAPTGYIGHPEYQIGLEGDRLSIYYYFGPGGVVTIPSGFLGLPVGYLGPLFQNRANIYSVTIPDSVILLTMSTFRDCNGLTNVTLSTNLTRIGHAAFMNCSNLTHITLPASLIYINNLAFLGCSKLREIVIPPHVSSFGGNVFSGCSSLTNAVFQNSLAALRVNTFFDCTSLRIVALPSSLSSIESGVFFGCSNLTSIVIPTNVTSLGTDVFGNCSSLKYVYFLGNQPSPSDDLTVFAGTSPNIRGYYMPGATGWGATFDGIPMTLWNTSMGRPSVVGNDIGIIFTGPPGAGIVLEACTNLTNPVWVPVKTNTFATDGIFFYSEPLFSSPARFYRFRTP